MNEQMKEALKKETERYIAQDILYDDVYVGEFNEKDGVDCAVHAVDWYRNNVWHDASKELPEKGKNVLASTLSPEGRGIMEGGITIVVDRGLLECDSKGTFKAWAYLDDLLPDKEKWT